MFSVAHDITNLNEICTGISAESHYWPNKETLQWHTDWRCAYVWMTILILFWYESQKLTPEIEGCPRYE